MDATTDVAIIGDGTAIMQEADLKASPMDGDDACKDARAVYSQNGTPHDSSVLTPMPV